MITRNTWSKISDAISDFIIWIGSKCLKQDSTSLAKIDLDGDHTYGNVIVGAHGMRFDSRDGVRFVIGRYENRDKNRRLQLVICGTGSPRPTGFKSTATRWREIYEALLSTRMPRDTLDGCFITALSRKCSLYQDVEWNLVTIMKD